MSFASPEFALLFLGLLSCLAVVRNNAARKLLLLAAGMYFYAWWDWRFLGLLLAGVLADYAIGLGLGNATRPARRRALLLLSLALNLGALGFFKYANFFLDSLAPLLESLGLPTGHLALALPLGISFFTFLRLNYVIDVFQGRAEPERSLTDFALYATFFAHIAAGPITRARNLLPQFKAPVRLNRDDLFEGFRRICFGLFKKVVLADRLGMFVDTVFAGPGLFDTPTLWLASLAYTLQIYLDFSGYSDLAIGLARCLGYRLDRNFDFPYLARNPSDFWRRWHISLSFWFRDYVYIPLGGNRQGLARTCLNLMLTLLLCGLWHGAGWTFVAWGAWHGAGLVVHRLWRTRAGSRSGGSLGVATATVGTLVFACLGWVLFRAPDLAHAETMLLRMVVPSPGVSWLHPFVGFAAGLTALVHAWRVLAKENFRPCGQRSALAPLCLPTLLLLSLVFAYGGQNPFLYFQF